MDEAFYSYRKLRDYFQNASSSDDYLGSEMIHWCTAADLLYIAEEYKKHKFPAENLTAKLKQLLTNSSGLLQIADLSAQQLVQTSEIWNQGARSSEIQEKNDLSTKNFLNVLTLKPTFNCQPGAVVYRQMCEEYGLNPDNDDDKR